MGEFGKLLPFYLVMDVSGSMTGAKIDAAQGVVPAVMDTLAGSPVLSDKVRFGVIEFATEARIVLPLADLLDDGVSIPSFQAGGATSWAAAFRLLDQEIARNVKALKADGFAVHRPAVFFLSDGVPTDAEPDWRAAFADLAASPTHPNIIPCGVDGADPALLAELVLPPRGPKAMRLYMMSRGFDAARAIEAFTEVLISSVLASGLSMAGGASGILLPDPSDLPPGISAHHSDEDFV